MAAPIGNKFNLGGNGGRPRHYETPEDLRDKIVEYFDRCDKDGTKATITGLALYLGFASRSALDNYEERGEDFLYLIKRAKLAVENSYELSGSSFDIFALKNMGWKDKTETEVSGGMGITWVENKNYGSDGKADTGN